MDNVHVLRFGHAKSWRGGCHSVPDRLYEVGLDEMLMLVLLWSENASLPTYGAGICAKRDWMFLLSIFVSVSFR